MDWFTDEIKEFVRKNKEVIRKTKYPRVFTKKVHCRNCGFTAYYKMGKCVVCNEAIENVADKKQIVKRNKQVKTGKRRTAQRTRKPLRIMQKLKKKRT